MLIIFVSQNFVRICRHAHYFRLSKFHLPNFTVSLVTEIRPNTQEDFCTVASLLFSIWQANFNDCTLLYRPFDMLHFSTCSLVSLSTDNFTFTRLFFY